MGRDVVIRRAGVDDAEQILKLQYLCYQEEAELYNDWALAPLTQSLQSLRQEFATHRVLVAKLGEEVVGSVRADLDDGTCRIGRLCVHPRLRRHGLGSRLMSGIEDMFPEASRFELFTGHRSVGNLRLYQRLGYLDARTEDAEATPRLKVVYLEKRRAA